MNNAQQTARVGLFFLLGLALVWVTYETLSGGKLFKQQGYTLYAPFTNLKELKTGDEVRVAGVKVGDVRATRLENRRAVAVLSIGPGYHVASDAVATVGMSGLLGTDYVDVTMGTAGAAPLADGAEIHTAPTPDINTIMNDLGNLGQKLQVAVDALSSGLTGNGKPGGGLFQKLDTLLTENGPKITATLSHFQSISEKIDSGQGTVGKLVNDPELHDQLLAAVKDLKSTAAQADNFMAEAQQIVDHVKSGQGSLGVLVYDPQTAENVKVTVQDIRDVSDKIAKGEGTLGKLLSDDSLYYSAQNTMKKADRALDGMSDSGPITAVGIVANTLF